MAERILGINFLKSSDSNAQGNEEYCIFILQPSDNYSSAKLSKIRRKLLCIVVVRIFYGTYFPLVKLKSLHIIIPL